jgi:hypothetical protein
MARIFAHGLPSAGLFAGPAAWFFAQTSKYAAVPWTCGNKIQLAHPITLVAFIIVALGAWLSWRALEFAGDPHPPGDARGGQPHRFLAVMGVGMALLFALAILLQGSAVLVLDGCER